MVNRILKVAFASPLLFIMFLIVVINVKLNYKPDVTANTGDTINYDLLKGLRGLKRALNANADTDMQQIYPEGYMFLNAIYALAWSNFLQEDKNKAFADEGRTELEKAWSKTSSATAKAPFDEELSLPYGAFYNGWSSYVLGAKLRLEAATMRNEKEVDQFKHQCAEISKAIREGIYPVSYYGGAWPADVVLCIAALSMHDKLFEPEYGDVIEYWLDAVKKSLDIRGLIPHSVHPGNTSVLEGARGSSQALMLIFLRDIDPSFAKEQFELFKANFIDTTLGLTGVREYPKGESGTGDIDSGPVIFGFGGAATIVGMQTLSLYGEHELSLRIRNAVEALAFSHEGDHEKDYFFGLLPIADAFITWSHSNMNSTEVDISFTRFRIYSFIAFISLSIFFWILISDRKPDSKRSLTVSW